MEMRPTVLVVDDDAVSLNLISKLVEKLNYNVVKAANGKAALAVLKKQPVELVISDYEMPELDGLQLLKQAKEQIPRLPFILVTAFSNLKVIREAWQLGAFDFFQKPVFVDRLHQTVRLAVEYGHLTIARRKFQKTEESQPDPDLMDKGVIRELAVALERDDLLQIVEEYETHAQIELEQIFRFGMIKEDKMVKSMAHRLAGTSLNLGLTKMAKQMKQIESHPEEPIQDPGELEHTLVCSIFWLKNFLTQIFQDLAV